MEINLCDLKNFSRPERAMEGGVVNAETRFFALGSRQPNIGSALYRTMWKTPDEATG